MEGPPLLRVKVTRKFDPATAALYENVNSAGVRVYAGTVIVVITSGALPSERCPTAVIVPWTVTSSHVDAQRTGGLISQSNKRNRSCVQPAELRLPPDEANPVEVSASVQVVLMLRSADAFG